MTHYQNERDLSAFGHREISMARDLLDAWMDHGLPEDFDDDGVTIEMNPNSGYVFLTNDNCDVCMVSDGKLESFYSCPECGAEGLRSEVHDGDNADTLAAGCLDWLRDLGIDDARVLPGDPDEEETPRD